MNNLFRFITYSGVAAVIFLLVTFITGITGFNYQVHRILAITVLILAVVHFSLIIYKNLKIKLRKK